jgi:outer membrane protein assembly factor BamB/tetratricopeptide (TPR) repeat protein
LIVLAASVVAIQVAGAACVSADLPAKSPISIDRSLKQPLAMARALIDRGQFAEAIRSLQPVLSDPQNNLVLMDGRYIDAKIEANRLIAELPPEAQALYEREFGGLARRELERAQASGRINQILAVAATYRHAEAGRQALHVAAGLFFDGGQFAEAAAAARALLDMPGPAAQESAAAARLVTAWLKLGQVDAAQVWVEKRREFLSRHEIEVQGIKHRLDQWLMDCIRRQIGGGPPPIEHRVSGGHPQSVWSGNFTRPSTRAIWSKRFEVSGVLTSLAEELIARRVESGIPPVFHSVPLIVGQSLVVRRGDELVAYDLYKGETRWSTDLSPAGSGSVDSETLADRTFSGGPQCALATDGQRIFTVVEDAASYVRPVFTARGRRLPVELPTKNSLAAYDLHGGKRLWRLTDIRALGPSSSTDYGDHDVDFLGPPLAFGGTLYVLGRTDEGANLLALDPADGTVRWGESLAGFSGFEADTASSFGAACVPVQSDGLLICPTPEGIVIAIDLATRTCRWAYRAQPTEEPSRLPPRWGRRFPATEARWLHAWRESVIRLDDRRCFFVSPRSTAIHALAIDTGKLVWTQPVPNGLFLGPIVDGRLLAVSQYRAFGFDPASGTALWNSPIGLPSGRGYAAKGRYLLPQAAGGLAAVDLRTGAVDFPLPRQSTQQMTPQESLLGNLVPLADAAGGAAVSQSHDQLALLTSLEALQAETAEKLRRHPTDSETLRRAAQLDREAGDFESAERRYAQLLESRAADGSKLRATPAPEKPHAELSRLEEDSREKLSVTDRRELFETLVADVERNPKRCPQCAPQLLRTATGDEQRAVAMRTVGSALCADGERMLGLDAFLQLARQELPAQIEIERGPRRVVAFDRQLGAELQDLLRACSPPERREADSRIQRALERAIEQGDAVLLGRVFQRLRGVGLDRSLRQRVEAALRPEPTFFQTQLELWEATTSNDARRAAEAWRDLAELFRSHGNRKRAAFCYRRLVADFNDIQFDDGLRPADLVAAVKNDRPLFREIEDGGSDPWPETLPDAIPDTDSGSSAQFFHLPLEIVPGSLCERLDVALDHQGETLRFQGDAHSTYWDVHLPVEGSRFRGVVPLHRAWGLGQLVIVQVGMDLFAVAPLDEGGEPDPRVLWHVDLLGSPSSPGGDLDVRFVPGAPGPTGERILVTDRLGRPVARVGPVRPGYVCYQDRGSLIALDPLSGRLLWRRADVSAADLSAGDDSSILLLDRRSKRLQFLRALDGKTVMERTAAAASDFRWFDGLDAVTHVVQAGRTRVSRINLFNDQAKWTRSYPAETQFVRLDERKYAAVEPDGSVHVLAADRGTTIGTFRIAGIERCLQVHMTSDESRFYLAFSKTYADSRNFRANGQRDESRNPLVNGVLCAVDRRSGRMLWNRPFADGVFALDQSRVAPMLVFSYRQQRRAGKDDEGVGLAWPILHCIDKRTGRDVFNERFGSAQPFTRAFAETELGRHEIILRWPDGSMRFRYSH